MRVRVWDGDGKTYLGEGEMVGFVDVNFYAHPDGHLTSSEPENDPTKEFAELMVSQGAELIRSPHNPKIVLDTGEVVYGCQVWWDRLSDLTSPSVDEPQAVDSREQ